jgi:hypothetical protein
MIGQSCSISPRRLVMKNRVSLLGLVVALLSIAAIPAFSSRSANRGGSHPNGIAAALQRGGQKPQAHAPKANGGRIPPSPPRAAVRGGPAHGAAPAARAAAVRPHVENNQWMGHNDANDPRYHLAHPFAHGHFAHVGPSFRYGVTRVDPAHHRFWFPGGFYFEVASWEWAECADWCWTCPDEFVIYNDPDSPGWYLLYNVDTGVYVHVQYMGS